MLFTSFPSAPLKTSPRSQENTAATNSLHSLHSQFNYVFPNGMSYLPGPTILFSSIETKPYDLNENDDNEKHEKVNVRSAHHFK